METIAYTLELTLLCWASFTTFYLLFYALLSYFYHEDRRSISEAQRLPHILILIPAYREDRVIFETAREALKQHYPQQFFQVAVVGDHLEDKTISKLQKLPLRVLDVQFDKSTKAKAINYALEVLPGHYDLVLILDADNIMRYDFLKQLVQGHHRNFQVMQGQRIAKNRDSEIAELDALSEMVNNRIFCFGQQTIGLSSRLLGSGMCFNYSIFKRIMRNIEAIGGFDKELEIQLLKEKLEIHFLPRAIVYDEKTRVSNHLIGQRTRWISAQYHYFKSHFLKNLKNPASLSNMDFTNKLLQLSLLPRSILLLFAMISSTFALLFSHYDILLCWGICLSLLVFVYLMFIPIREISYHLNVALRHAPRIFLSLFMVIPKMKSVNKNFIHTPHQ
ncbi:MAG: glycosyltransferase family 2 protein [Bacteroidetes bacterium]|nr:MAG: glycosyltransferase family 2 protein [Bacteroidota bacterium]